MKYMRQWNYIGAVLISTTLWARAEVEIAPKTLQFLEATTISGYVESSYAYNFDRGVVGAVKERTGVATVGNANLLHEFDRNFGFSMNAFKVAFEKPLGDGDLAAGYRADILYGQDAVVLSGDSPSSLSLGGGIVEQGYAQFRAPLGNGLDFKLGKFATFFGFESVDAPDNLNFSRSLMFTWGCPHFHTGLMGGYACDSGFDVQVGVVNGWNNDVANAPDPTPMLRLGYTSPNKVFSVHIAGIYGREPTLPTGTSAVRYTEFLATWRPNDKWLFAADIVAGSQKDFTLLPRPNRPTGEGPQTAEWHAGVVYAQYKFTEKVNVALRGEYFDDDKGCLTSKEVGVRAIGDLVERSLNLMEYTATINFSICNNLLTRLEYRYDRADKKIFNGENCQNTVGVDAVYSF